MDERELQAFLYRIAELSAHDSPENVKFYTLSNGTNLNDPLPFYPQSVVVDNHSSAYLDFLDAGDGATGRFVPPNQPAVLPILNRSRFARVKWVAPPGKTQPTAITSEQAQIIFFRNPIPPGQGLASQAPLTRWNVNNSTGANVQASVTKAASTGVTHVGDSALFGISQTGATAAAVSPQVLDGSSAGVVMALGLLAVPATVGQGAVVPIGPGLNFRGTVNNGMTANFGAAGTTINESVSLSGFDQ